MVAKAPCKNCEDRQLGCHSQCERYKKFKEESQAEKENIEKQKRLDGGAYWTSICRKPKYYR